MAFAVVQASAQTTGTGSTVPVTISATTIRNLICVHIAIRDTNETCTGVTDDKSNTYTLETVVDSSTNARSYFAWSATTVAGVTTVTSAFSGSVSSKGVRVEEYSGVAGTQIFAKDVTNTGSGTAGSPAISTFTPNVAGELIVASYVSSGSVSFTAGASYTLNGAGSVFLMSEYRLSGTTSETAPITGPTGNWSGRAIAFKTAISVADTTASTDSELFDLGMYPTDTTASTDSYTEPGWGAPAKSALGTWQTTQKS